MCPLQCWVLGYDHGLGHQWMSVYLSNGHFSPLVSLDLSVIFHPLDHFSPVEEPPLLFSVMLGSPGFLLCHLPSIHWSS